MSSYPDAIASVKQWIKDNPDAPKEDIEAMKTVLKQLQESYDNKK